MGAKHTKHPLVLRAEMIMGKTREIQSMTPEQLLGYARGELEDTKINVGYKIGFGFALIELMYYWQETDENLKDFIERHNEFLEVYGSTDAEDKKKLFDLFDELYRRTGFQVRVGNGEKK